MGLIIVNNNREELFDTIVVSEIYNSISLSNNTSGEILNIEMPFNLKKIPPKIKDPDNDIEEVLIFKNQYFKQLDILEVVSKESKQRRGYLFSLSFLNEDESKDILEADKILQICVLRSIFKLLQNKTTCKAKRINHPISFELSLFDFYDPDVIIGVFPHEWESKIDNKDVTNILFELNRNGFYFIKNHSDLNFQSTYLEHHELNLSDLDINTNKKRVHYKNLKDEIHSEIYLSLFIKDLIKYRSDPIVRFHINYQNVEIISDIVLKKELKRKICNQQKKSLLNGYQLKKITDEVSKEKYRIDKFFKFYSVCEVKSDQTIQNQIISFFNKYLPDIDDKNFTSFGPILYELRNKLVHNLQFIYSGSTYDIKEKLEGLSKINDLVEYAIIDSITKINYPNT